MTLSLSFFEILPSFRYQFWWLRQWRICLQYGRPEFNFWFRKIPQRREWLPTPLFLPAEFQRQRSLAGYSPWNCRVSDTTEPLTLLTHSTVFIVVFVVWCIFLNSPAFLYLAPWMASISLPNLFALVLTWHVALGPVFFLSITAPCWPHPILSH